MGWHFKIIFATLSEYVFSSPISGFCGLNTRNGIRQSLATFSIASLGESNWWVTLPQSGHRYPSIMFTSRMMGIPLWRRKSMVRVIPRADMSEGWETITTPSSDSMLSKKEKTSLAAHGNKHVISMLLSPRQLAASCLVVSTTEVGSDWGLSPIFRPSE